MPAAGNEDQAQSGQTHAATQQADLDEAAYRSLLESNPGDLDQLRRLATQLGQRGQYAPAIELLERALAINPADASTQLLKGNCLLGLRRHAEALACYDKAIALEPNSADLWMNRGTTHRELGQIDQALSDYERAIALSPDHVMAHQNQAALRLERQDYEAAVNSYRHVLRLSPDSADACFNLGIALAALNRHEEALACYEQVLTGDPANVSALANRGLSLHALRRHDEALARLNEALRIAPNHVQLLVNHGAILLGAGRCEEALASFDKALLIAPGFAIAHCNRGTALERLMRHDDAVKSFDHALSLEPDHVDSLAGRANNLYKLRRNDEALATVERALTSQPKQVQFHVLRAQLLKELRRPADALTSMDSALALRPDDANLHCERAKLLTDLKRPKDAMASYGDALAIDPDHTQALFNRGYLQIYARQGEAAVNDWARLARIVPDYPNIQGYLLRARMYSCDWHDLNSQLTGIREAIDHGKSAVEPLIAASLLAAPRLLKRCAETYVANNLPVAPATPLIISRQQNRRIRVGYMCGEFRHHAATFLTVQLYEQHDRQRFEVVALDNGYDDGSASRKRLEKAFDVFVSIAPLSDANAIATIRRRGIDILVDLNGHTGMRRTAVLSQRPAPIQVNWLGFPGTMGAPFMDYILADPVIIPPEHDIHFTEKVVRLPDTYQSNDNQRSIAEITPTRAQANLPEDGFVFCCFNDNYKITPEVFDIWMRLLKRLPKSVLWLLEISEASTRNLRAEASARGVAPDRLIFAPYVKMDEYLARHRLADLFLDTLPYNAHTTASDALWSGLPLLTCLGSAFAGRVAASLLRAAGLPELVTHNADAYETLAFKLATTPALLASLRGKLATNRSTCALFDAQRFTRHIESAYTTMHERALRGEAPASFDVTPLI